MKVESGRNVGSTTMPKRVGGAAAAGFAPVVADTPRATSVSSLSAVTALDAVLALQTEEQPAQRRTRQAKRGLDALDALEKLEQGLVAGRAPAALRAELERLRNAAELTGEPGLDGVLREIDTRVAVELAKLERLASA